jgi:fatty-acyl-CoA synthase
MPDQYAGEVPALFVVPSPNASVDVEALKRYLDAHVQEPPARPKSVLLIEALPVTAVGKIFKPMLRELAIKEKVRLEVERCCGSRASAFAEIRLDEHKRTIVEVAVSGANASALAVLDAALKPLPQSYLIRASEV